MSAWCWRASALETRVVAAARIQELAIFSFCWKVSEKSSHFFRTDW